jgi:hypothetical protein
MKNLSLIATVAFVGIFYAAAPATAKNYEARSYQWCQRTPATDGNPQCTFTSYRQCQASISGVGGDCIRNPRLNTGRGVTSGGSAGLSGH